MKKDIYYKVYLWLFIGLLMTFATGLYTSNNQDALEVLFRKNYCWIFALIQLGIAFFLAARITKIKPTTAKILFLLYSFLTGLTFSSIFVTYKITSIILVFGITSMLFLLFALIGRFTKIDLTKLGTFLVMILIGTIICSIVNIFIGNSVVDTIICIVSMIVFLGFIAYDIQRIESLTSNMQTENLAIFGAFELYLDFINVFVDLLRLIGDMKD